MASIAECGSVAQSKARSPTTTHRASPPAEMVLFLELFHLRGAVLVVDATLASKALDVGKLVDGHGVLLVQRSAVQELDGGDGLFGCLVLDKGVAFSHVGLFVEGHEDQVLAGLAGGCELAQDEFNELLLAILWHLGEPVDNDKRVESFFHLHFILVAEIWGGKNGQYAVPLAATAVASAANATIKSGANGPEKSTSISSRSTSSGRLSKLGAILRDVQYAVPRVIVMGRRRA